MTIEELKLSLNDIKLAIPMTKKTIDMAIEVIRKYQKIQTIVKAWNDVNSFDSMTQISEVVEDGNN